MRVPSPESNGSLQAVENDKDDFVDGGEMKQNFDQMVDLCCAFSQNQACSYSSLCNNRIQTSRIGRLASEARFNEWG